MLDYILTLHHAMNMKYQNASKPIHSKPYIVAQALGEGL
jgi:hypothetical protein